MIGPDPGDLQSTNTEWEYLSSSPCAESERRNNGRNNLAAESPTNNGVFVRVPSHGAGRLAVRPAFENRQPPSLTASEYKYMVGNGNGHGDVAE